MAHPDNHHCTVLSVVMGDDFLQEGHGVPTEPSGWSWIYWDLLFHSW